MDFDIYQQQFSLEVTYDRDNLQVYKYGDIPNVNIFLDEVELTLKGKTFILL